MKGLVMTRIGLKPPTRRLRDLGLGKAVLNGIKRPNEIIVF
jgi:hypothetical protein